MKYLLILIMLLAASQYAWGQVDSRYRVDAEEIEMRLADRKFGKNLTGFWKYHGGDNMMWADTSFNHDHWDSLTTFFNPDTLAEGVWEGIGWFRIFLEIDSTMFGSRLALFVDHHGASEVYLDGKLMGTAGTPAYAAGDEALERSGREPLLLTLGEATEYLLSIRYSNHYLSAYDGLFENFLPPRGMGVALADYDEAISTVMTTKELNSGLLFSLLGTLAVLAILHLFVYFYLPAEKVNLYYSCFLLSFALMMVNNYMLISLTDVGLLIGVYFAMSAVIYLIFISFMAFIYSVMYDQLPAQQRYFVILGILAVLLTLVDGNLLPVEVHGYVMGIYFFIVVIESVRVIIIGIRKKRDGVLVVTVGFLGFLILLIYLFLLNVLPELIVLPPALYITFSYLGLISIPLSMSVYLARKFARTNKDLAEKLIEVRNLSGKALEQERKVRAVELSSKLLEAENQRKTQELEEARRLQLSMLPATKPDLEHLEIAVYMKTAAEVGGDYYDFYEEEDGTLMVAVGDATGHGLRAGTMVSVVKGLFSAGLPGKDLIGMLEDSSRILYNMRLGNLFMALSLVRINGSTLRMTNAGMPPAYLLDAEGKVNRLLLKSMPLGFPYKFPYEVIEKELQQGDTLVLYSDGLIEQFNEEKEMFDYPRFERALQDASHLPPAEMIDAVVADVFKWRGEQSQNDDMTLMVLRMNGVDGGTEGMLNE